jgi:hypothetical protein
MILLAVACVASFLLGILIQKKVNSGSYNYNINRLNRLYLKSQRLNEQLIEEVDYLNRLVDRKNYDVSY